MNIGEKIKKLRTDKNLSQENIYSNQSLVSQIEKGINNNPTEQTLKIMADKLDISLEELIDGTDWKVPHKLIKQSQLALSETECLVTIEDSGQVIRKMKHYPRYNETGDENKYDPDTGYKLLVECPECKRDIEKPNQIFCMGCGEILLLIGRTRGWKVFVREKYFWDDGEEMNEKEAGQFVWNSNMGIDNPFGQAEGYLETEYTKNIEINRFVQNRLKYFLGELEKADRAMNANTMRFDDIFENIIHNQQYKKWFAQKADNFCWKDDKQYFDIDKKPIKKKKGKVLDVSGFLVIEANKIKNKIIEDWWLMHKFQLSYHRGVQDELMRHELRLIKLENEKEKSNDEKLSEPKQKKEKNS